MSEHVHDYKLDVQGGFYYCASCDDDWSIQDLLKECIGNLARIKALEGVVKTGKQYLSYGGLTHHKDGCRPKDKCECGLWKLRNALKKLEGVRDG